MARREGRLLLPESVVGDSVLLLENPIMAGGSDEGKPLWTPTSRGLRVVSEENISPDIFMWATSAFNCPCMLATSSPRESSRLDNKMIKLVAGSVVA